MDDLIERLQSHMGKADMGEVLADCRLAAERIATQQEAIDELVAVIREVNDLASEIGGSNKAAIRILVRALLSKHGERT